MTKTDVLEKYTVPLGRFNVLLHYKTFGGFNNKTLDEHHTNLWEISEMTRILLSLGCNVDLLDRSATSIEGLRSNYDFIISNASGNSGQFIHTLVEQFPSTTLIFYAAGVNPILSNDLVLKRYGDFSKRHSITVDQKLRLIDKIDFLNLAKNISHIICIDDNGWSSNSYKDFSNSIYSIRPSASPNAFNNNFFSRTIKKSGVAIFLGNGFIVKGADILMDIIDYFPKINFHLAGPASKDSIFWKFYKSKIYKSRNLSYYGYLSIGSKKYQSLINNTSWSFHYSSTEGCSTSLSTTMTSGLLPIANFRSGVDLEGFGISISDEGSTISNAITSLKKVEEVCENEIFERKRKLYRAQNNFSRSNYSQNLRKILEEIIYKS